MKKMKMGPIPMLWAHPTTLVGADVDGKPDFAAVAWAGVAANTPPAVSIALQHPRYSLKGIRQNLTFSVNIPSRELVKEADYCGLISGSKTDKVKDCKFKVFYGKTPRAPLIEQCPINLECEVRHILNMGSHALVIGEVMETHVSEDCLTEGKPDPEKIDPFIFIGYPKGSYYRLGEFLADAFSIGKELKKV
jgi:flavin reductase (DIM6/NTAB) family NADH-FMN oxidoreductase RutF